MFIFDMINGPAGFDPLIVLLLAMAIEAYVGGAKFVFKFIRHPIVIVGDLIGLLDRKLNREKRSQMDRAVRGFVTVIIVVSICGVIGYAVSWLSLNHPWGWILEFLLIVTLIAQRALFNAVRKVGVSLLGDSLEESRDAVSHIVGRDPTQLDSHGVARAAIESLAENFSDGVVAPVFWYVLFGFPGLLIYKAINTMDSMIGYKTPKYQAFGFSAARIDDIVNIIPARLSGLFVVIAAIFVPTASPLKALKVMLRDAGKHRSLNAGWPEGAMAGALNLTLAGPRRYPGRVVKDRWIGDGTAKATHRDIRRALYLYAVACLINAGWIAALALVRIDLLP